MRRLCDEKSEIGRDVRGKFEKSDGRIRIAHSSELPANATGEHEDEGVCEESRSEPHKSSPM